ncbi:uncharacterized protein LOC144102587 [Amblyomma americanum]
MEQHAGGGDVPILPVKPKGRRRRPSSKIAPDAVTGRSYQKRPLAPLAPGTSSTRRAPVSPPFPGKDTDNERQQEQADGQAIQQNKKVTPSKKTSSSSRAKKPDFRIYRPPALATAGNSGQPLHDKEEPMKNGATNSGYASVGGQKTWTRRSSRPKVFRSKTKNQAIQLNEKARPSKKTSGSIRPDKPDLAIHRPPALATEDNSGQSLHDKEEPMVNGAANSGYARVSGQETWTPRSSKPKVIRRKCRRVLLKRPGGLEKQGPDGGLSSGATYYRSPLVARNALQGGTILEFALKDPDTLKPWQVNELVDAVLCIGIQNVENAEKAAEFCAGIIAREKVGRFDSSLLYTCTQWFEHRDVALARDPTSDLGVPPAEEPRHRWTVFVTFLAELVIAVTAKGKTTEIKSKHRGRTFCLVALFCECCKQMLQSSALQRLAELECLRRVLKKAGRSVVRVAPRRMEALAGCMREAFVDAQASPEVTLVLLELLELRASRWKFTAAQRLYYSPQCDPEPKTKY